LQKAYPDAGGFFPRNLRRMREFNKLYSDSSDLLDLAMQIGCTQNVVIMEDSLTMEERAWYLRAAEQSVWFKSELMSQISASAHLALTLDEQKTDPDNPEENRSGKSFVSVFKKSKNYCKLWMLSGFRRRVFIIRLSAGPVLKCFITSADGS